MRNKLPALLLIIFGKKLSCKKNRFLKKQIKKTFFLKKSSIGKKMCKKKQLFRKKNLFLENNYLKKLFKFFFKIIIKNLKLFKNLFLKINKNLLKKN